MEIGKCGNWEMWKLGNVEIGKCGNVEMWKCENLAAFEIKIEY